MVHLTVQRQTTYVKHSAMRTTVESVRKNGEARRTILYLRFKTAVSDIVHVFGPPRGVQSSGKRCVVSQEVAQREPIHGTIAINRWITANG